MYHLAPLSFQPLHHIFVRHSCIRSFGVPWCVTVCHTVYPSVQTALLTNVRCNQLLVWFKASGFFYPIKKGHHQDSSHVSCCCPELWRSCSCGFAGLALSCTATAHRWVDVGGGCWLKELHVGWSGSWVDQSRLPPLAPPVRVHSSEGWTNSPTPMPPGARSPAAQHSSQQSTLL